ncbi:MAG: HAMP domain-containing sensor histidine kinase [Anaerolineae bacterium]
MAQQNSMWRKIWNLFTEPSSKLTDITARKQAHLLAIMLIVILFCSLILAPLLTSFSRQPVALASAAFVFIPYLLSRTRYYKFGTYLTLAIIVTAVPAVVATSLNTARLGFIPFMIVGVVLSSLLLSKYEMAVVSVIISIVLGMLPRWTGLQIDITMPFMLNCIIASLLLVFMFFRDSLEHDRQAQLESALQLAERANTELAKLNSDLIKANAAAEESARLKSEFLARMSHELRTPLNAIRGFCGVMVDGMGGEIDDEARHMVQRIDSNGERLLNLINDILDIAKIEAGRMEISSELLDMHDLVFHWQSQMGVLAVQKHLTFDVHVDPALPPKLYGDREHLTQVVVNLLSNAFKFTSEGGIKLDVRADVDTYVIEVADTGIGIPPHALDYIFEEFRQVDGSSQRMYGGTGLGLSIVRNLCRMMGGSVRVSSELEVGSVFTVRLPLVTEASEILAKAS